MARDKTPMLDSDNGIDECPPFALTDNFIPNRPFSVVLILKHKSHCRIGAPVLNVSSCLLVFSTVLLPKISVGNNQVKKELYKLR